MESKQIINLSSESVAQQEYLLHPESYEWREPVPSLDDVFDASVERGLSLRCVNCAHALLPQEVQNPPLCPDCGCEAFDIKMLFIRREEQMPDFRIHLTGSHPNRYVHIDAPAAAELIRYTTDGSPVGITSPLYSHPFALPLAVQELRARCYTQETQSQELLFPVELPREQPLPTVPPPLPTVPPPLPPAPKGPKLPPMPILPAARMKNQRKHAGAGNMCSLVACLMLLLTLVVFVLHSLS